MAFTYTRDGFPFQRFAQTLLFMLREMSLADRAFQAVTGRSNLVRERTTAAGCLPGISRRQQRRVKGLLLSAQGWEVKHPPTLLPSHTQARISAAGVPSPYLSPAWPSQKTWRKSSAAFLCIYIFIEGIQNPFWKKNVASSGCSETGNKNACD